MTPCSALSHFDGFKCAAISNIFDFQTEVRVQPEECQSLSSTDGKVKVNSGKRSHTRTTVCSYAYLIFIYHEYMPLTNLEVKDGKT